MSKEVYVLSLKTREDGIFPIAVFQSNENLKEQIEKALTNEFIQSKLWYLSRFNLSDYLLLNSDEYYDEDKIGWCKALLEPYAWILPFEAQGILRLSKEFEVLITATPLS